MFDVARRYKGASGSSAVCAFTMAQVERAFSGRYREVNRETQQWYTYNHPVPEPRPGAVSTALLCSSASLHSSSMCPFMVEAVYGAINSSNSPSTKSAASLAVAPSHSLQITAGTNSMSSHHSLLLNWTCSKLYLTVVHVEYLSLSMSLFIINWCFFFKCTTLF